MNTLLRTLACIAPATAGGLYNLTTATSAESATTAAMLLAAMSVLGGVHYSAMMHFRDKRAALTKRGDLITEYTLGRIEGKGTNMNDYIEARMKDRDMPLVYRCPICERRYTFETTRCKNKACKRMRVSRLRMVAEATPLISPNSNGVALSGFTGGFTTSISGTTVIASVSSNNVRDWNPDGSWP